MSFLYASGFSLRLTGLMGRGKWTLGWDGIYFPKCRYLHTFFTFLKPDILFLDANDRILGIIPSAKAWRFYGGPQGTRACVEVPTRTVAKKCWRQGMILRWKKKV
jgi:uncharacterized membrane protein (UPF0127 family)